MLDYNTSRINNSQTETDSNSRQQEWLGTTAVLFHGFALDNVVELQTAIREVTQQAPYRHMETPGGFRMSVAMTNCGKYGWISDRSGYRYEPVDPLTSKPWPTMPDSFLKLSQNAAAAAGFKHFIPDVCLVNCYEPGAKISLHQDRDELDFRQPIVSVSLGVPAIFLFGGLKRKDVAKRIPLEHGDVVVWGGVDRMRYHGILPLKKNEHCFSGGQRINLTFRKAK